MIKVTLNPLKFPLARARDSVTGLPCLAGGGIVRPSLGGREVKIEPIDFPRRFSEMSQQTLVNIRVNHYGGLTCFSSPDNKFEPPETEGFGWSLVAASGFRKMVLFQEPAKVIERAFLILQSPTYSLTELENLPAGVDFSATLHQEGTNVVKVAPSLLSADFTRLGLEIKSVDEAGADLIHFDVMDGHFVPNITFGLPVLESIKNQTRLPFDVHLMISEPLNYVERLAKAGAGIISFHVETITDMNGRPNLRSENEIRETIGRIESNGVLPALVLNPSTPVELVKPYLGDVGLVLLMTVWPGFGGQKFIENEQISSLARISQLRRMIDEVRASVAIEVDGGINVETAAQVRGAGATVLVAGYAVFREADRFKIIRQIRG